MAFDTIHQDEQIKQIPLTQGLVAIIDANDYKLVSGMKWQAHGPRKKYAMHSKLINGKHVKILMHRLIAGTPQGMVTDHINGNTLDNRRANLRICTSAENARNRKKKKQHQALYKGISLRANGRWLAQICVDYRRMHIGVYDTQEEAAQAYNRAAVRYFSEFALLNNIPVSYPPSRCRSAE